MVYDESIEVTGFEVPLQDGAVTFSRFTRKKMVGNIMNDGSFLYILGTVFCGVKRKRRRKAICFVLFLKFDLILDKKGLV